MADDDLLSRVAHVTMTIQLLLGHANAITESMRSAEPECTLAKIDAFRTELYLAYTARYKCIATEARTSSSIEVVQQVARLSLSFTNMFRCLAEFNDYQIDVLKASH